MPPSRTAVSPPPAQAIDKASQGKRSAVIKRGDLDENPTVDGRGRFRIEGLVPGVKYDALGTSPNKAFGPVLEDTQVASGEVRDLGDIKLPAVKRDGD